MGRPSKLTPEQWSEIERRLVNGEGVRALGGEFGISPGQISKRFPNSVAKSVRAVAEKVVDAQTALEALPIPQQALAMSLAATLRSISTSLASAAELGAKTAHRLHALANAEVGRVDDAEPLSGESLSALKGVGVLTKLANDSSVIALNLLSANRDKLNRLVDDDLDDEPAELTPERMQDGVRRIAFVLQRAAQEASP